MNTILGRDQVAAEITDILQHFDERCRTTTYKKGIYVYGSPGCGKTHFVTALLKELNYDIIQYDAGDVRNKTLIDTITCDNISNRNVLELMFRRTKKIAIVMDEIDGMNNGDKGGITQLIKLIRQKKTKKQKLESVTLNPIVCIGNYNVDKKIKELMKVCHVFELKPILPAQIRTLFGQYLREDGTARVREQLEQMTRYVQGDLRKFFFLVKVLRTSDDPQLLYTLLHLKSYNDDAKEITKKLLDGPVPIQEHNTFMNETDRTTIALLFHENVADRVQKEPNFSRFYADVLRNICFADYMDRITFQNQIWVFNEMTSLIKTFANQALYHRTYGKGELLLPKPAEVRFTKVLTKYSTEYNNQLFLYNLCQQLDMDKKDVVAFFQELRFIYGDDFLNTDAFHVVEQLFEETEVCKLDIKRMYRFLDKSVKPVAEQDDEDAEL